VREDGLDTGLVLRLRPVVRISGVLFAAAQDRVHLRQDLRAVRSGRNAENLVLLQIVCAEVAQAALDLCRKPIQLIVLVHVKTWKQIHENRYLPLKEGDWREETAKIKKYLIQADLVDAFHDYRMENFDKVILQNHLNKLAKIHSRDRVLQIRSYMRAIFAEAVDQDFLAKDPARKVKPPANLREVDKTTLSWDQLRSGLEKLDELSLRDWILMKLDMSNALRPSELFPLRWRCFLEETNILDIQETSYKGKIRPFGKTKGSLTQVPIADILAGEIVEYREECRKKGKDVSPDGFMFPGRFGGRWIRATIGIAFCTN
jgi:integrase